ncbi:hypothetical protein PTSG_12265 [Salpingoeca rosetta]|uniref:Uncharacterized protein n=1 Tax=Salpingoeca rosetta (strain ATCC 50818 / BSB-021) TaxID=946362 RepID=F2UAL9_SALR5|nr:uncharacterized protein PTSG_12265 [Salpingoeca rosetta]EGD73435.1 hypothetical protein PTSG_12265 [Salpingoeca rosetta]|eukprot:XP_004993717.1 hypothetical protein PTSG_12265 [Salpingoeca rosetta]
MCDAVLMRRPNEKRAKREKDATYCYKAAVAAAYNASEAARLAASLLGEDEADTSDAVDVAASAGGGDGSRAQREGSESRHGDGGKQGAGGVDATATAAAAAERGSDSRDDTVVTDDTATAEHGPVNREHNQAGTAAAADVNSRTGSSSNPHQEANKAEEQEEKEEQEEQEEKEKGNKAKAEDEEEQEEEENEDEQPASALGVLSGALITMIDSFPEHVTRDMPIGNTQVLSGTLVHVAYVYLEDDYVLAVACDAAACPFVHLQTKLVEFVRVLKSLYCDFQALLVSARHHRLLTLHLTRFFAHLLASYQHRLGHHCSIHNHPSSLRLSIAGVRRRPRVIQKALHLPSLETCDPRCMISSGRGNAVFHFLAAEPGTGLVLVSDPFAPLNEHSLQAKVLDQFYRTSLRVRALLHQSRASNTSSSLFTAPPPPPPSSSSPLSSAATPSTPSRRHSAMFPGDHPLSMMEEHGLMFTVGTATWSSSSHDQQQRQQQQHQSRGGVSCNPAVSAFQRRRTKRASSRHASAEHGGGSPFPLSYWVVGRLLPPRGSNTDTRAQHHAHGTFFGGGSRGVQDDMYRELYVCFRDGAAQDTAEMAFKLFSGL